jgi:glucose-6-phosphate isomerase
MSQSPTWNDFSNGLLRYSDPDLWLDLSRMGIPDSFYDKMEPACERALDEVRRIEAGEEVNSDEGRMVGHYWLRNPDLAPDGLGVEIERKIAKIKTFAHGIHSGEILAPGGEKFRHLILVGIGGSALGPQLAIDALTGSDAPMSIRYFDNTDPDGIDRDLAALDGELGRTLTLVISKSGGTKETRNGMLEAKATYEAAGLDFGAHAVAITGPGSALDTVATEGNWLGSFPMEDWVGGRTSITSVVGLVPMALLGIDIDQFLAGAAATDEKTRSADVQGNASLLLALAWHHAGGGVGAKDMVILPYKDRLSLLSKYLQQLVMESIGKELDRDGKTVHQGIAVDGNKGSTDQHAYVQQLRDGLNNFFATFIEVRESRSGESIEVDPATTSGDYLEGFLRGTRRALFENGRASVTLSIPRLDAYHLGCLIALYERAVSFYAAMVNINAYHQPGVEAGKKAATDFLDLLGSVAKQLGANPGSPSTAAELATAIDADPEDVFHCLQHLATNRPNITTEQGSSPTGDTFVFSDQ